MFTHSKSYTWTCIVYKILYTYVYFFDFNEAIKPQHTADQYHVGVAMPFHLADVPNLAVLQQHTGVNVDEQRPLHHPQTAPQNRNNTEGETKKTHIE